MCAIALVALAGTAHAQRLHVPRKHDRPPGPPLSPHEAVAKMTVPEGFSVEIVAAEPDIVNPVAMFIDEKGRFWITESLEYPRREPGPGRDRVKVLEDTDGDGRVDKVTVFADGLNIPSGIAVGYGGVWVANSPDLLFMQDTDGDLKADKVETVVTGFGRTDTHELPNSLTWGPDGWLYGLNGVFNYSHVKYAETNPNYNPDHPGWEFTCAMFRIHPRTREFQVFAEGTSNPWGIAINDEGDFFISACVIDHLWHIVETGYYIRQGGPYPPHTWPMGSIVEHKHQKAAYCGITWFDSDAYPEEYRRVLYMGNIHGGCINADIVERHGSTYRAKPHPGFRAKHGAWDEDEYGLIRKTGDPEAPKLADFLTANDAWFMPVVQKTGPDGCLYILDWYDRYHCYQDANADPDGIERAKGRLYRVVYDEIGRRPVEDLSAKSDLELFFLLTGPNEYVRDTSQRLLAERLAAGDRPELRMRLSAAVGGSEGWPTRARLRALWTLASSGRLEFSDIDPHFLSDQPAIRAWAVRLAPDLDLNPEDLMGSNYTGMMTTAARRAPPVVLQSVVGVRKVLSRERDAIYWLLRLAKSKPDDHVIQAVVWQNLHPLIGSDTEAFLFRLGELGQEESLKGTEAVLARVPELLLEIPENGPQFAGEYFAMLDTFVDRDRIDASLKLGFLKSVVELAGSGELGDKELDQLKTPMHPILLQDRADGEPSLQSHADMLLTLWGHPEARTAVRRTFLDDANPRQERLDALKTLIAARDESLLEDVDEILATRDAPRQFRSNIIMLLGDIADVRVADVLLDHMATFEPDLRPRALESLTQRPVTAVRLLEAIDAGQIDKNAINLNQILRMASMKDPAVAELFAKVYGSVRADDRGDRRRVVDNMRNFLSSTPGDPHKGIEVYRKVCGQCHKIYGEGAEVGPDITANGRNDWMQLLYNVFDPSQVIGPGYQARILVTTDGRVLTGLPVEESEQRVVLKTQGGKVETVPRAQIDEYQISDTSMMPEQLEKQLNPQELADLFSFLALDKPPSDPSARYLPGAPRHNR